MFFFLPTINSNSQGQRYKWANTHGLFLASASVSNNLVPEIQPSVTNPQRDLLCHVTHFGSPRPVEPQYFNYQGLRFINKGEYRLNSPPPRHIRQFFIISRESNRAIKVEFCRRDFNLLNPLFSVCLARMVMMRLGVISWKEKTGSLAWVTWHPSGRVQTRFFPGCQLSNKFTEIIVDVVSSHYRKWVIRGIWWCNASTETHTKKRTHQQNVDTRIRLCPASWGGTLTTKLSFQTIDSMQKRSEKMSSQFW